MAKVATTKARFIFLFLSPARGKTRVYSDIDRLGNSDANDHKQRNEYYTKKKRNLLVIPWVTRMGGAKVGEENMMQLSENIQDLCL